VFVFSKRQRKVIEDRFRSSCASKPVVCLHVPDRYEYKSPKLVMRLTGKLGPYLGSPTNNEWTSTNLFQSLFNEVKLILAET
jgi:hypothetical protein